MSMTILTILQICAVFSAYMVVTCVMPFVLVRRLALQLRLTEQILLSIVFGNFYIINEVFVLQLLHISNHWTLLLGTLLPYLAAVVRVYRIPVRAYAAECRGTLAKLLRHQIGRKSLVLRGRKRCLAGAGQLARRMVRFVLDHPVDVLLFIGVTAMVVRVYLPNLLENYGYCTSDIPVHNYWINALGQGKLFVAGVYPFGFHCAVYYLHAVFGLETYVMLRVFCFVQTVVIHWMMLLFLKGCLKSGYLAYLGTILYVFFDIFQGNTYTRYASTLPQEFGMIFILPAVYFGFAYFKKKKNWCLAGFAMSFSLTLAVHFYDMMIAGLFALAMAVGFAFRFFRKTYFVPVVVTCCISVAVAVAPMVIAYATGTQLQGSLGWGLNIISSNESDSEEGDTAGSATGSSEDGDAEDASWSAAEDGTSYDAAAEGSASAGPSTDGTVADGAAAIDGYNVPCVTAGVTADLTPSGKYPVGSVTKNQGSIQAFVSGLRSAVQYAAELFSGTVNDYISLKDSRIFLLLVFGSIPFCFLLSLIYLPLREHDRVGQLLTVGIFMIFMNVLLAAGRIGLPRLMDGSRASIYYAYMLPVIWCFCADGVLSLPGRLLHRSHLGTRLSLAVLAMAVLFCVNHDMVRAAVSEPALEYNQAITCLTNIMSEHDDLTWTICSANDELRMGEDYGYHYETITFLWAVEYIGRNAGVTIPTKYTYFFVEKKPLDYGTSYAGSGQYISEEGAERTLPANVGLSQYKGENRWIVMSRMYYWCEAFMEMYPEDMTVYYEDDDFICYQLVQNTDHLFELGIDYGYNNFYK